MSDYKEKSKTPAAFYYSHPAWSFFLGVLTGLVFYIIIYEFKTLIPTNVDWLLHSDDLEGSVDLTQHYLGWVFYRNSPWQFPLGLTRGIYSSDVSVIYTDSIPLFAFLFKLLSPILPDNFQYFGLYGLMCYCLMGGFGVLLIRRVCQNPIFHLVGAVFFVSNPILLNRMFLHTALAGHFLIVAGLCLYFYNEKLSYKSRVILWTTLISCGTLINAYFTPMLFGLLFFAIFGDILSKNAAYSFAKTSVLLALPVVITALLCYIMGMFYGKVPSKAGGLEVLSFNLNGFFNPLTKLTDFHDHIMGYRDMNYSKWLPGLPLSTAYQNEGFSYLGVGMFVLILLVILIALSKPVNHGRDVVSLRSVLDPIHRSCLILFMLILLGLSLSPVATLGENELYHLPLPTLIHDLWSSFRSTARFIWPVYYCIMAMTISYVGRLISDSAKPHGRHLWLMILTAACVLQLLDLSPGYLEKWEAFLRSEPYESRLSDPLWDELGKNSTNIVFYPPTEYGLYEDGKTSVEFEIYAQKHHLTLNNSYMSRNLCSQADEATLAHFDSMAAGSTYPREIYVFFDCIAPKDLPDPHTYHLKYFKLNGYTVAVSTDHHLAQ